MTATIRTKKQSMKPLKIIHIANRADKKSARTYYSLPYKINNGLVRNNHNVIWFSDRDIARAEAIIPSQKLGRRKCNDRLVTYCRNFEPDLLLLGHANLIESDTINAIRKELPQARVAQYWIDTLGIDHNVRLVRSKLDCTDITFVTTAGSILKNVASATVPAAFVPNPVDASIDIHRCHDADHLDIDVFFAGQKSDFCDPDDLRNQVYKIPELLPEGTVKLLESIWGASYMRELGRAKIGLNLSSRPKGSVGGDGSILHCYSSDRISQYLGNGLLAIVPACFNLARLYGADGLVEVETFDDMIDKLRFYVQNDAQRRRVAATGHSIAHAQYSAELVTRYMIEATFGLPFSHAYVWPTERYFSA